MQTRRNLLMGILSCVVGMVGLLSVDKAEARKGGLPLCLEELATCTNDLGTCQTDLEACEAAPNVIFPGDGYPTTSEDRAVGIDHGPALSYTDNGDGTFTDNNTHLVWEKKDNVDGSVHNVERRCQLNRTGAIATSTSECLTDCFLQAAKARLVISCQLWNLLCIS